MKVKYEKFLDLVKNSDTTSDDFDHLSKGSGALLMILTVVSDYNNLHMHFRYTSNICDLFYINKAFTYLDLVIVRY